MVRGEEGGREGSTNQQSEFSVAPTEGTEGTEVPRWLLFPLHSLSALLTASCLLEEADLLDVACQPARTASAEQAGACGAQ